MNKVIILGNLTRDPETRSSQTGTTICRFGLAHNKRYKTASGEQREDVLFVDVVAFAKKAEVIQRYLKKGARVIVEGELHLDQWEDKTSGEKKSRHTIQLSDFTFVDRASDAGAAPADARLSSIARATEPGNGDDDIPF